MKIKQKLGHFIDGAQFHDKGQIIDIFNPFLKNSDFEKSQTILKKSLDKNKNIEDIKSFCKKEINKKLNK